MTVRDNLDDMQALTGGLGEDFRNVVNPGIGHA